MPPSRRQFVSTALTAAVATVAGCVDDQPGTLGTTSDPAAAGPNTVDDGRTGDGPTLQSLDQWLPAPGETSFRPGYAVVAHDAAEIRAHEDGLHPFVAKRLREQVERLGALPSVEYGDLSVVAGLGFGAGIVAGEFAAGDVVAEIRHRVDERHGSGTDTPTPERRDGTDTPTPERRDGTDTASPEQRDGTVTPTPDHFTTEADQRDATGSETPRHETTARGDPAGVVERGTYGEFALYETPSSVFGIRDGLALVGSGFTHDSRTNRARVEAIVDARNGDRTRYREANPYVDAMYGVLDDPTFFRLYPEAADGSSERGLPRDEMTGGVSAWRFDDDAARLTAGFTYADAETATTERFRAWMDDNARGLEPYENVEVDAEGLLVYGSGTIPLAEFDFLSPGPPDDRTLTHRGTRR